MDKEELDSRDDSKERALLLLLLPEPDMLNAVKKNLLSTLGRIGSDRRVSREKAMLRMVVLGIDRTGYS